MLAGLAVGTFADTGELTALRRPGRRYEPGAGRDAIRAARAGWSTEIRRARLI
jgi:glycerol kinase